MAGEKFGELCEKEQFGEKLSIVPAVIIAVCMVSLERDVLIKYKFKLFFLNSTMASFICFVSSLKFVGTMCIKLFGLNRA